MCQLSAVTTTATTLRKDCLAVMPVLHRLTSINRTQIIEHAVILTVSNVSSSGPHTGLW